MSTAGPGRRAVDLARRIPVNRSTVTAAGRLTMASARRSMPFPLRAPTVPGGVELPRVKSTTGANYDTDWAR
ncbi:MAG TPA: hypothetical protein VF320_08415, partial [Acidimicrobiales bacterium]